MIIKRVNLSTNLLLSQQNHKLPHRYHSRFLVCMVQCHLDLHLNCLENSDCYIAFYIACPADLSFILWRKTTKHFTKKWRYYIFKTLTFDLHNDVVIVWYNFDSVWIRYSSVSFFQSEIEGSGSRKRNLQLHHITLVDGLVPDITIDDGWSCEGMWTILKFRKVSIWVIVKKSG